MYTLKGFAHIGALVDNELAAVAPVGELAPIGLTYAREKTFHVSAAAPSVNLITFSSNNDGVRVPPADTLATDVLAILDWVYNTARSGGFNNNIGLFQQAFLSRWGNGLVLNESGTMVRDKNLWCPGFIDIELINSDYGPNRIKVWFANELFLNQFDEYEIVVVPPVVNLDNLFNDYRVVRTYHSNLNIGEVVERIRAASNGYPYTALRSDEFDWIDRNERSLVLSFPFTTIVYGIAGDNIDNVKNAIIDYVLANSKKDRDEWAIIFPDIFTATEFIITPMWNDYSVPNKVLETGIYSPVTHVGKAFETVLRTCKGTGYTRAHIASVLTIVSNPYKQINLAVVGGPDNRGDIDQLDAQFPDYTALPSTHVDFGRMAPTTREFVLLLADMLRHAETLTPSSSVPLRFTRMQREGIYYLVRSFEKVQYLVVSKYSLNDAAIVPDLTLVDSTGITLSDFESNALSS